MRRTKILFIIGFLVIIGVVVYFLMSQTTPEQKIEKENKALLQAMSSLILLPNEEPIIVPIEEAEILMKEQAFYQGSMNGDKLVIFPKAEKAIIYSPERDLIINSGPFVVTPEKK